MAQIGGIKQEQRQYKMSWQIIFKYWGFQAGIIIFMISLSYVMLKRGINIKGKNFSLNANLQQIGYIIKNSMRSQKEMDRNEFLIRPQEQMNFTDDKIEEIYNLTMKVHTEILKKKTQIVNIEHHPQIRYFSDMLENVLEKVKKKSIKRRFKNLLIKFPVDEYDDYSSIELEFNKHRDHETKIVVDEVATTIQKEWVKNDWVEFNEIEEGMIPVMPEIEKKVSEAFQYAIEIQLKTHKKNCIIESKVDDFINNLGEKQWLA
jgi:hypothetical protein